MAALGPEASNVVAAGRRAMRASPADRDRIEAALRVRLGAGAFPLPVRPAASAWWRIVAPAVAVCALGGIGLLLSRAQPVATTATATATVASSVVDRAPAAPLASAMAEEPVVALPAPAKPAKSGVTRAEDQLVREVALLSRATRALGGGRTGEALKALNEHQVQFPNGALAEERRGAKARALCSLGRFTEGRRELAQLSSGSVAASRARPVCDAAPGK
jgi:hypothetical protein